MTGATAVDKRSPGDFLSLIFAYLANDILVDDHDDPRDVCTSQSVGDIFIH